MRLIKFKRNRGLKNSSELYKTISELYDKNDEQKLNNYIEIYNIIMAADKDEIGHCISIIKGYNNTSGVDTNFMTWTIAYIGILIAIKDNDFIILFSLLFTAGFMFIVLIQMKPSIRIAYLLDILERVYNEKELK